MGSLARSLAGALVCAAASACAGDGEPAGSGRGVLVIVIDGLRADHVGALGYDRDTTPQLDLLAQRGVVFENAFSTAPWTLPAHASLLTGCDPLVSRRILPPEIPPSLVTLWHVPEGAPHLAQELLRQDYDTAAFLDHSQLAPMHGFARGFESYAAFAPEDYDGPQDFGVAGVGRRFQQWLRERSADANWFAYLQISDLERTWTESDEAWDTRFTPRAELAFVPPVGDVLRTYFAIPRARWAGGMRTLGEYEAEYDGAIARVDQALGRVFSELEAQGRLERTTIVVTSSHGVGFGEAGLYLDHGTLSDVDLHVPLIVRPANDVPCARGSRSAAIASAIDLAPTLLALEKLPVPPQMHGVSLARALAGAVDANERRVFARCGYQEGIAVIDQRYCFESTAPWKAEDRALAHSWYGGPPPSEREQREVLHDRAGDARLGHLHSAPLDEALVGPMRAAAGEWEAQVERLRQQFHAVDWMDKLQAPATPPAGSGS